MKPSVGRIVHYVSYGTPGGEYGKECRAAIVTEVSGEHASSYRGGLEPVVGLCVLNPAGQFFNQGVKPDQGLDPVAGGLLTHLCGSRDYRGGTWHWPEREAPDSAPQVHVSPDLSPAQVKDLVQKVQAALLQQAKRGRRPGTA